MWKSRVYFAVFLMMTAAIVAGCDSSNVPGQMSDEPCDRTCLEGFVEQYLDAAIAHNPNLLPLSEDVKFTENGVRLPIPDAHWKIMTGKGKYRLFVTDPDAGQVACIATIREEGPSEEGVHSQFAIRLRVKNRRITEIETLVARPEMPMGPPGATPAPRFPNGADLYEKMGQPHPVYLEAIPPDERMSREDLIKTANMYFSGLEQNDGQGEYPFTDDCDRLEGGMQTTNAPLREGQTMPDPKTATMYSSNWSCKEQFESGLMHFVWRIHDRRFVAVDQERGLVFSLVFFDHALGADRTFTLPNGREITSGPMEPNSWQIAELFKIENGLIRRIEAIMLPPPYGMNSGWSSYEDGISSEARDVTMTGH